MSIEQKRLMVKPEVSDTMPSEVVDPFQEGYEKFVSAELYLQKEIKHNHVITSMVCGAFAGICAKTFIAPAERIKMTFQVSAEKFTFRGAFLRAKNVIMEQGVFSLWKGHSTTILRIAPYSGLSYAIHDYSESTFKNYLQTNKLPGTYKFLAGSLAGSGGTLLTYPLDVLRVRLALGQNWSGAIRQGGLFQGLFPTLLGIVPYSGTAWAVKQTLLEELFPAIVHKKPTVTESLVINALAGYVMLISILTSINCVLMCRLCGQFVTYPLDIVRRRMQIAQRTEGVPLLNFR